MNHRTVLGFKLAFASIGFLALTIFAALGLRAFTGYNDPSLNPSREPASFSNAIFESEGQLNASELGLLGSSPQIRGQKVRVNLAKLMDAENPGPRRVVLNLFSDVVLNVDLQAPSIYSVNSGLLVGLVDGDPESFVRIVIQDGVMNGTIRTKNREYQVIDGGNGLHIVTEKPGPK